MMFDSTLVALQKKRETLVERCDEQRQRAAEVFSGVSQQAAAIGRIVRPASLLEEHPALAAALTVALLVLRRRMAGSPLIRLLLLEPVLGVAVRLLKSAFARRREAPAQAP
jgi:hypothetical protein